MPIEDQKGNDNVEKSNARPVEKEVASRHLNRQFEKSESAEKTSNAISGAGDTNLNLIDDSNKQQGNEKVVAGKHKLFGKTESPVLQHNEAGTIQIPHQAADSTMSKNIGPQEHRGTVPIAHTPMPEAGSVQPVDIGKHDMPPAGSVDVISTFTPEHHTKEAPAGTDAHLATKIESPELPWPEEKTSFEKEHGVKLQEKSGRIEYHLQVNGKDITLYTSDAGSAGLKDGGKKLDELVAAKERQLHGEFGVNFRKAGESQNYIDGDNDRELKCRNPRVDELYGVEAALIQSKPASFGGINFAFLSQDLPGAAAEAAAVYSRDKRYDANNPYDRGRPTVYIPLHGVVGAPVTDKDVVAGDNDKENRRTSIQGTVTHELGHAADDRWSGTKKVEKMPNGFALVDPVYDYFGTKDNFAARAGWHKVDGEDLLEGKDGSFYKHVQGATSGWTRVDQDGKQLDRDGHPTDEKNPIHYDDEQMREMAKVRPYSTYFDNAAESYAEALEALRLNQQSRKTLLTECPEMYSITKEIDQKHINEKYPADSMTGEPTYVRNVDGRIVPNTPGVRAAIYNFEHPTH